MKKVGTGSNPSLLLSLHFDRDGQSRGAVRMEIKEGLVEKVHCVENDPQKRLYLLAFRDFCFDLFEEEYGEIPSREEIDPRLVRNLLIQI